MLWMMAQSAASAVAAAAQAQASHDAMQIYRDMGANSLRRLAGVKCEYCRGTHAKDYCPSCGAPTPAQQRRNEGNR